jgi:iron complex outermembrane receptor protein
MANQSGQWHRKLPAVLVYAVAGGGALPARAQSQVVETQQLPEVVVSAQRTAQLASKTPVAMTVLRGESLEDAGIDHPAAIGARVPGVHIDGAADGLKITIRGVSNNDTTEKGDPSAAFMQDGIYIARPQSQNQLFFDLARVEVLRGPQGTLYGRNTTAGVVNVISNQPGKRFEGAVSFDAGNYASRKGTAMLNVPVSDALALRGAIAYNKHDSYLVNGQGTGYTLGLERDDLAARVSATLALGRGAALLLRADRSTQRDNSDSIVPADNFYTTGADGGPVWTAGSTRARLTNAFVPPNAPPQQGVNRAVAGGLGAELDWDLGALTLHYLGAHRSFEHDHTGNYYYWVAPVALALGVRESFSGRYRQDSHELRLATSGAGPLTAQAGVYYFRERADVRYQFRDLELLGLTPYYVFPMAARATGKALFGQATHALGERMRATLGARYSDDGKARTGATSFQQGPAFNPATDFALPNVASLDTHKATWRLGAEFDLAPGTLLFGTVSTGYKAGGFNDGCLAGSSHQGVACPAQAAVPAEGLVYQPETLTSYEAGFKSRFWGGRASLNASAFYYDYANLQLSGVVIGNGAPLFLTTNAAQARVRGLEFEGEARTTAAGRLRYSLALLDAHYASYLPDGQSSWAGRKLDRAPATAVTLGYEHDWRLGAARLKTGLFTRYSSDYVIGVPSQLRQYRVPSRTESDLALDYAPDGAAWSVHATVRNLENKVHPVSVDSFRMLVPSAPRTWALRLDLRF